MNREWTEQTLGREVAAHRFAMIELALYLDTHPGCDEARMAFDRARHNYESMKETYTRSFGPMMLTDTDAQGAWTWGERPMPEEGD